jgi:hypothetical protein
VSQPYTDAIQLTLAGYFHIPIKRDINELVRGNPKSVPEFVAELRGDGKQVLVPDWMLDPSWAFRNDRSLDSLTVEQHRDVRDFVTQLIHLGKDAEKISAQGEAKKLAEVTSEAAAQVRALGDRYGVKDRVTDVELDKHKMQDALGDRFGPPGRIAGAIIDAVPIRHIKSLARQWDASLIRMERLFSWFDNRDSQGLFNTYGFRDLVNAGGYSQDLRAQVAKKFREMPELRDSGQKVENSIFRDVHGRLLAIDRQNMLMVMLNMGNESNMSVLTRGYNIERGRLEAWVHANARPEDWVLARGIWDIFEHELWPLADKNSRELTGVGLKKIEPREIDTPHGKITGGYFPLIEALNRLKPDERAIVDPFVGAPLPTRGYTKYRTGKAYPLSLDFGGIARALNEQIHDIAYSVPLKNAQKFLQSTEIRKAISDVFGVEYVQKIDPWLKFIASNGGKYEPVNDALFTGTSRFLRQNAAMMLVGLRPGTAVIHGAGAAFNSLAEGRAGFLKASGEMSAEFLGFRSAAADLLARSESNRESTSKLILDESSFMRNRKRNLDRDLNAMLTDTFETGVKGKYVKARALQAQYTSFLIANLDQMSAHPTWLAGYREGLARGMEHKDAVYNADQMVRNAHGSSGLADQPSLMRGKSGTWEGEAKGWVTLFGTYWNHVYNQMRDKQRAGVEGLYTKDFMMFMGGVGAFAGYAMANTLSHELTRGKQDADDPVGWVAHGVANTLSSTQPIVRDIAHAVNNGMRGAGVNIASAADLSLTTITKGMLELYGVAIDGDDVTIDNLSNALRAPGYATGLGPTDYMVKLSKYAFGDGRAVDTPWEAWRLMLDAQAPPKKRKSK